MNQLIKGIHESEKDGEVDLSNVIDGLKGSLDNVLA